MKYDDMPRMKVLIVDDDPVELLRNGSILRSDGHEVVTASNGKEAIKLFAEGSFDVVFLDLELPDIEGLEVCKAMRMLPGGEVPRIIFLTARENEDGVMDALEAGADDFLNKPMPVMMMRCRLVIASRNLERRRTARQLLGGGL